MKNKITRTLMSTIIALSLVACGGGASDMPSVPTTPTPPPPPPAPTYSVQGKATASKTLFAPAPSAFARHNEKGVSANGVTMTGTKLLAATQASTWNCDAAYNSRWLTLPKNVDTNGDSIPDTNVTNANGAITFNIDVLGNRLKMINVGSEDNVNTLLNKDALCEGIASVNVDTNNDQVADTNIDSDGDNVGDYSIIDASAVSIAGAEVTMKNMTTNETYTAVSGADGKFTVNGMKSGTYDMTVRAKAPDGQNIWNVTRNLVVGGNGDMGTFGLSRNPVLREVYIDDVLVKPTANYNFVTVSKRKLVAGDVIKLRVVSEDPNGRAVTVVPYGSFANNSLPITVNGDGTLNYTVTAADVLLEEIQLGADMNNNDGVTGMDAFRDMNVRVTYAFDIAPGNVAPDFNGITVNGSAYVNPVPSESVTLTTAPVADGADIAVSVQYPAAEGVTVVTQWKHYNGPMSTDMTMRVPEFTVPGAATAGVYAVTLDVAVTSATGKFNYSTIKLPVITADRPAKMVSLTVNTLPSTTNRVFRVGEVLTIQANATDELGKPMEYAFNLIGTRSQVDGTWTANNTITYTVKQEDVTGQFGVRVFVRNNDGRLNPALGADDSRSFNITTSE